MATDEKWMDRALALARRGQGKVHPNPMVGAVLVKNGRVVGEGYHRRFGGPHAEIEALRRAGDRARGATLYVTLEPCAHWGKTPPCVDAVIAARPRAVVAAMRDPNPLVAGRGLARLRRAGLRARTGPREAEARELNRAFAAYITQGRPYVTVKAAASLDGKIAAAGGESRWITSPQARRAGHALRAEADAVAVGIETVLRDDPALTAHGRGVDPRPVVFDSRLRIPARARLLRRSEPAILFTTAAASLRRRKALERRGARVFVVPSGRRGQVDVAKALGVLHGLGVAHLLVEGGGRLHASFFESGRVDEVAWFVAPMILGGAGSPGAVAGAGARRLRDAWRLEGMRIEAVGPDLLLRAKVARPSSRRGRVR